MSNLSLADFNGDVPWVVVRRLARTDTVTAQGTPTADHINEAGTFVGHQWGLSHGHAQASGVTSRDVLDFVAVQQRPRAGAEKVVRISDGGAGLRTPAMARGGRCSVSKDAVVLCAPVVEASTDTQTSHREFRVATGTRSTVEMARSSPTPNSEHVPDITT